MRISGPTNSNFVPTGFGNTSIKTRMVVLLLRWNALKVWFCSHINVVINTTGYFQELKNCRKGGMKESEIINAMKDMDDDHDCEISLQVLKTLIKSFRSRCCKYTNSALCRSHVCTGVASSLGCVFCES